MTPTVGRIVLVTVDPHQNNGGDVAPGVITRVWSDVLINIRVFLDGVSSSPAYTSIALYEDRATLDMVHNQKRIELEAAGYNPAPALVGAYWPPRV